MAGAQVFCRLRSYLSTARKQHRDALGVLCKLQQGQPLATPARSRLRKHLTCYPRPITTFYSI